MGQAGLRVEPLHTADFGTWWPLIAPLVAKAVEHAHGFTTLDEIAKAVACADMQAFAVVDGSGLRAACITEIKVRPALKTLNVIALGGDGMDEWLPALLEVLEAFGRHLHCKRLMCVGRRGWVRALQSHGWDEIFTTVSKDIGHG